MAKGKFKYGLNINTHDDFDAKDYGKMLEHNGYKIDRRRGSHIIYTKQGVDPISIKGNLNAMIGIKYIKQRNLIYQWN